jgi:hypothetical protein
VGAVVLLDEEMTQAVNKTLANHVALLREKDERTAAHKKRRGV